MAKCTEKERELIDKYLSNDLNTDLIIDVLREKVSKNLRDKVKKFYIDLQQAQANYSNVLGELYSICSDKNMRSIVSEIEQEANDSK